MANFVAVPADTIADTLSNLGFARHIQSREVVFIRRSVRNPSVMIKVYTSVRVGQSTVRAAGRDAIRVCVVFDNGSRSFGIGKFPPVPRVHSAESVVRRLRERIGAAVKRGKEWMDQQEERFANAAPRDERPGVDFSHNESYLEFLAAMGESNEEARHAS